ncbi:MAG: hypothetical protein EOL87_06930 [Spartobacteria bacterium]|nr:hypothetical protein [Spartobacteria bacterium]
MNEDITIEDCIRRGIELSNSGKHEEAATMFFTAAASLEEGDMYIRCLAAYANEWLLEGNQTKFVQAVKLLEIKTERTQQFLPRTVATVLTIGAVCGACEAPTKSVTAELRSLLHTTVKL